MTDPVQFDSSSARFGLPLLFQGQAQKEAFVNEAFARTDALLHCAVQGRSSQPPVAPEDGDTWIVAPSATGDWSGQDGSLAARQAGQWFFFAPVPGMRAYDVALGQEWVHSDDWKKAAYVQEPTGGEVVDVQARAAVAQVITALQTLGFLPEL